MDDRVAADGAEPADPEDSADPSASTKPSQGTEPAERPEPTESREPSLVDGEEHRVDPRTVQVGRIVGFAVALPLLAAPLILLTVGWAFGGIAGAVFVGLLGVWLALATALTLFVHRWPAMRYEHLRYLVEHDGLRIRRGVFWRKVIWIPITRVQHTDVSQGPVQRKLGLGTLTVHTAGTAGSSISLPGLEHGIASRLSDHLRPATSDDAR